MRVPVREKFAWELAIENLCNATESYIIKLVTGTSLEFFILDPTGRWAAVAIMALILALCVGRLHVITDTWQIMVDKILARMNGQDAGGNGGGFRENDGTDAAGDEMLVDKVSNNKAAAELAARLQNMHIATSKRTSGLTPLVQAQRNRTSFVERKANNMVPSQTQRRINKWTV